jgi:transmembrane sensor
MPDYANYKAADFLLEESFLNYCRNIPADKAFWENFIEKHPATLTEINHAKNLYSIVSIKVSDEEKKMAANKLKVVIELDNQQTESDTSHNLVYPITSRFKKYFYRFTAAAAVAGIIIYAAVVYNSNGIKNYNTPISAFTKASYRQVIQSGDDQRKQVQLADGSTVLLNCGSVLKVSDNYNQTQRWVYLEGEAFFSVTPDKNKPFVVITNRSATSALGTSFKVRSYPGEDNNEVMLATGKVKVQAMLNENSNTDLILLPGEQAASSKNNVYSKSTFNLSLMENWRNIEITFDKANLSEIMQKLKFNYGVKVTLQNRPSVEIAFTGKFFNKSLQEVLEAISFTNKFNCTQTGNTVSILFK